MHSYTSSAQVTFLGNHYLADISSMHLLGAISFERFLMERRRVVFACYLFSVFIVANVRVLSIDVHVTSVEAVRLLEQEERLLTHLGIIHDDFEELRQDFASLTENATHHEDIIRNPLNVFYIYQHWRKFANQWNRFPAPKEEVSVFLSELPSSEDVAGVAQHIMRLINVYNITVQEVLEGSIMLSGNHNFKVNAVRGFKLEECFTMVDVAYSNIMQDEYATWHKACQEMIPGTKFEEELLAHQLDSFEARMKLMDIIILTKSEKKAKKEEAPFLIGTKEDISNKNQNTAPNQLHESGSNSGHCFTDFSMLWISKIEVLSSDPLVVYFHDLLSEHTIRQIVEEANPRLEVPRTVSSNDRTVKSSSSKRSGKVAFISHQGHLKKLKYLTSKLTGLETEDVESMEPLQVVHYGIGGHYEPHVDYFGTDFDEDDHYGDRMATMLFYLSDDFLGGSTVFPLIGVAARPQKGSALFWFNTQRSGIGDIHTMHAGCPIISGTKWIANFWIRDRVQTFKRSCPLNF